MRLRLATITLFAAAALIAPTHVAGALLVDPDVIFDNLDSPQNGHGASSTVWFAQSFVTGLNPKALGSVDVKLLPHVGTGQFLVRLFSNASGAPGLPMETLAGPTNPEFGTFHYRASGNSSLLPNSPYWIVFSSTGNGYHVASELPVWGIEVGSSIGCRVSTSAGTNWEPFNHTINMLVRQTVPVPEPSSALLIGIALCGAISHRRRPF